MRWTGACHGRFATAPYFWIKPAAIPSSSRRAASTDGAVPVPISTRPAQCDQAWKGAVGLEQDAKLANHRQGAVEIDLRFHRLRGCSISSVNATGPSDKVRAPISQRPTGNGSV